MRIIGQENLEYGRRDRSHWPLGTFYLQKFALPLPTSGGSSVGIVLSWTQATEVFQYEKQIIVSSYFQWYYGLCSIVYRTYFPHPCFWWTDRTITNLNQCSQYDVEMLFRVTYTSRQGTARKQGNTSHSAGHYELRNKQPWFSPRASGIAGRRQISRHLDHCSSTTIRIKRALRYLSVCCPSNPLSTIKSG
jgi:hypothetical protein